MDAENLLRRLVSALDYQNFSGFYFHAGKDLCIAGCREDMIVSVFNDHHPDCPYRLAVEAFDAAAVVSRPEAAAMKEDDDLAARAEEALREYHDDLDRS